MEDNYVTQAFIRVQVCYLRPGLKILEELVVPEGTILRQAILLSSILKKAPEIDLSVSRVGVYGRHKTPETVLRHHDRVEIYRPLIADPKESRRKRAEKSR